MVENTNDNAISPTAAKLSLGRNLFRRVRHEGQRGDSTAFEALKRVAAGQEQKPPTDLEKKLLFGDNKSSVRAFRAAGLTDEEIYNLLNR